eukprot:GEMP01037346.1.p1 GENE.GEMP01037346.1~~GEMP01037346.1.p1  ORF type:complete len:444 (+),score=88.19 GEMP01037346.1:128-1459(+)
MRAPIAAPDRKRLFSCVLQRPEKTRQKKTASYGDDNADAQRECDLLVLSYPSSQTALEVTASGKFLQTFYPSGELALRYEAVVVGKTEEWRLEAWYQNGDLAARWFTGGPMVCYEDKQIVFHHIPGEGLPSIGRGYLLRPQARANKSGRDAVQKNRLDHWDLTDGEHSATLVLSSFLALCKSPKYGLVFFFRSQDKAEGACGPRTRGIPVTTGFRCALTFSKPVSIQEISHVNPDIYPWTDLVEALHERPIKDKVHVVKPKAKTKLLQATSAEVVGSAETQRIAAERRRSMLKNKKVSEGVLQSRNAPPLASSSPSAAKPTIESAMPVHNPITRSASTLRARSGADGGELEQSTGHGAAALPFRPLSRMLESSQRNIQIMPVALWNSRMFKVPPPLRYSEPVVNVDFNGPAVNQLTHLQRMLLESHVRKAQQFENLKTSGMAS